MKNILLQKTKQLLLKNFKVFKTLPQTAIITGSGITLFGDNAPLFEVKYSELPDFKNSMRVRAYEHKGVKGHEGRLKLYKIKNKGILVFSGRHHLYQGFSFSDVTANVRLAYKLGIKKIIITNAAGGINKKFKAGDLMLITGFIDLMQPTERGILSGITQPPKKVESNLNRVIQNKFKTKIKTGIYAGMLGPSYETFAEIKLLKLLGASAVGMSTVPEILCAKSLGLDCASISLITNVWNPHHTPAHKEVLKQANKANKKLNDLISRVIKIV